MLQKLENNFKEGNNLKEVKRIIGILEKMMSEYQMRPDYELKRDKSGVALDSQEKIKNKFTAGYITALFGWIDVLFKDFTLPSKEKFEEKKRKLIKKISGIDRITESEINQAEELARNIIRECEEEYLQGEAV